MNNNSTNSISSANNMNNKRISNPTPSHNNLYSLSLNRHHHDNKNHFASKHGVGGCVSTLTSPYSGYGVEKVHGGSKSDIGIPLKRQIVLKQSHLQATRRKSSVASSSFIPNSALLPSVYSDMSLFDAASYCADSTNNNETSSLTGAIAKTGSKLLYTNAHRKSSMMRNGGPLVFHNSNNNNTDESEDNGNWENSYDNPIRSVSYFPLS